MSESESNKNGPKVKHNAVAIATCEMLSLLIQNLELQSVLPKGTMLKRYERRLKDLEEKGEKPMSEVYKVMVESLTRAP